MAQLCPCAVSNPLILLHWAQSSTGSELLQRTTTLIENTCCPHHLRCVYTEYGHTQKLHPWFYKLYIILFKASTNSIQLHAVEYRKEWWLEQTEMGCNQFPNFKLNSKHKSSVEETLKAVKKLSEAMHRSHESLWTKI